MGRLNEKIEALTQLNTSLMNQVEDLEKQVHVKIVEAVNCQQSLLEQAQELQKIKILEQEQRSLVEVLRETVITMGSTLDLDKILDHILDSIQRITPYDGANVLFVESDLVHVVRQRGYIEKGLQEDWLKKPIPITRLAALQQMMDFGKPLITPKVLISSTWFGLPGSSWINSNVIAPIRLKGKTLGFLSLDSAIPDFFTQTHADQLQVFADQTAIAIQNARLYDRAKRAAVLAERNRLANELHDTISQTLWSISLIAERLPSIWELNREEGQRSIDTLYQLAQSALAEMRTLLLELRPSELVGAKLGDLIRQQAEVFATRTGITFSVSTPKQDTLPPHIQVILYRVVQEALNNIARHASARHVTITFNSDAGYVELLIRDDGRGFDIDNVTPGHLGLSIMRDRLQSIGAKLETSSQMSQGTLIRVLWTSSSEG